MNIWKSSCAAQLLFIREVTVLFTYSGIYEADPHMCQFPQIFYDAPLKLFFFNNFEQLFISEF